MCQNSLCVFFWLIWLSAPSVKFEQAKDNKNDEVRSHHQDHHKKRDATQESTWFNRAVGMYFILEDQNFENNQRFVPNISRKHWKRNVIFHLLIWADRAFFGRIENISNFTKVSISLLTVGVCFLFTMAKHVQNWNFCSL